MPRLAHLASLTLLLLAASPVPALALSLDTGSTAANRAPSSAVAGIRLAQAAGPTTAGGTLPYISSPDAKPGENADVPAAKQQSTSTPPSDAAPKPDVADQGRVKRLIDPDLIAKQRNSAPNPQPGAMPATSPAPTPAPTEANTPTEATTPTEAKTPTTPTEAKTPAEPQPTTTAEPVPAPSAPSEEPAANTAATPTPAPTVPSQPQQDQATTTPTPAATAPARELKTAKTPAKSADRPKTAKTRSYAPNGAVHDHPVTDAYYYKGRPRRDVDAYPVPPLGIPAPSERLYADQGDEVIIRRVRPVCRTYLVHDFIFTRRVTRCY